jgi:hypothetical protein
MTERVLPRSVQLRLGSWGSRNRGLAGLEQDDVSRAVQLLGEVVRGDESVFPGRG